MKTLYFDCFSGVSGDMTVGALVDLGADFAAIEIAVSSLNVGGFHIEAEKVTKKGVRATQFRVVQDDSEKPHRHLRHVVEIIQSGELPEAVKTAAIETFQRLAEAEAAVHGTTVEKVHFHEVGTVDSIVDIVAAQYGLHLLGIEKFYASRIHVGAGTVRCAHGVMPVPAPATARLLEGKPVYGGAVEGELVTPTGAALLDQCVADFGRMPAMTLEGAGYGSGERDLPDRANVLRVLIGESAGDTAMDETIRVIEAHVDDMNPELLPPLIEALLAAGARDAFLTPILGKKGRPAHVITALSAEEDFLPVTDALFDHASTLGIRTRREERQVLERAWRRVQTPWGPVRVKTAQRRGAAHGAAPEFQDCRNVAEAGGVPVRKVYEAALAAAVKEEFDDA